MLLLLSYYIRNIYKLIIFGIYMRLVWDPKRSELVEQTIDKIVDRISNGDMLPELSPSTLVFDLEEDESFRKFYFASFRREGRSQWSQSRFPATPEDPSGFQSFVDEVGRRLGNGQVLNTKKTVALYHAHTNDEIGRIMQFREMYRAGEITMEEAIETLRADFDVCLTNQRAGYYFTNGRKRSPVDKLLTRLKKAKQEVNIDLSNLSCLKGLMFEGMVGVYLMDKHGPENVESQVRKPVVYRDLRGCRHREVYLDYVVDGENVEVKFQNTLENILDSVLPQTFAFGEEQGVPTKSTVICRSRNPELEALFSENVSLEDEAARMGIHEAGRRIQDVFDYVAFDKLVAENGHLELYQRGLSAMDRLDEESMGLTRSYIKAFARIQDNPDGLIDKYGILVKKIESKQELSEVDLNVLFGAKASKAPSRDVKRRLEVIEHNAKKSAYRMLIEMYNLKSGKMEEELMDSVIQDLETTGREEFVGLCRTITEERKNKRVSRKKRNVSQEDILGFHERAYKRRAEEAVREAHALYQTFEERREQGGLKLYEERGLGHLMGGQIVKLEVANKFFARKLGIPESEVGERIMGGVRESCEVFGGIYTGIKNLAIQMEESGENLACILVGSDGLVDRSRLQEGIGRVSEALESLKVQFPRVRAGLREDPLVDKLIEERDLCLEGRSRASKKERDVICELGFQIWGEYEGAALEYARDYLESCRELSGVHNLLGMSALKGFTHVRWLDYSEIDPEKMDEVAAPYKQLRYNNARVFKLDKLAIELLRIYSAVMDEQTIYYLNRGEFLGNKRILEEDRSQIRFLESHLDQAFRFSSDIVGFNLLPWGIDAKTSIANHDAIARLDDTVCFEGMSRQLEHNAKILVTSAYRDMEGIWRGYVGDTESAAPEEVQYNIVRTKNREIFDWWSGRGMLHNFFVSDYLSKRAYNARVLGHYNPESSREYLEASLIGEENAELPTQEFSEFIWELYDQDTRLFRGLLTQGRSPNVDNDKEDLRGSNGSRPGFFSRVFSGLEGLKDRYVRR